MGTRSDGNAKLNYSQETSIERVLTRETNFRLN